MKKLTALMLAAAMSMTALTACGSKTEESAAAPASTEAAKEEGGKAAEGGEAKETSGLRLQLSLEERSMTETGMKPSTMA